MSFKGEEKENIGVKTIIRFILSIPLLIIIPAVWIFDNVTLKETYLWWFDIIDERTDSSVGGL